MHLLLYYVLLFSALRSEQILEFKLNRVAHEDRDPSLHGSGVHGGVIALDDSFDAEALAMAMNSKIPQNLHEVQY